MADQHSGAKEELFEFLSRYPAAVPYLYRRLRRGRIHGLFYVPRAYSENCCDIVGTVAKYLQIDPDDIVIGVEIERYEITLRPGDKPRSSETARTICRWIAEWKRTRN